MMRGEWANAQSRSYPVQAWYTPSDDPFKVITLVPPLMDHTQNPFNYVLFIYIHSNGIVDLVHLLKSTIGWLVMKGLG